MRKRRGRASHLQLNESIDAAAPRDSELIALDDALDSLERMDRRKARVVEMRFFGGLSRGDCRRVEDLPPKRDAGPETGPRLARPRDGQD